MDFELENTIKDHHMERTSMSQANDALNVLKHEKTLIRRDLDWATQRSKYILEQHYKKMR